MTVAVGAGAPLADQQMMADYFHGRDGLGGIYESHPHLSPADTWETLFKLNKSSTDPEELAMADELKSSHTLFTPSQVPAHEEILRLLRDNEPDTFTIVAVGPLTNLALAAAADTETFLRAKNVVVMGGAINFEGNVGLPPSLHNPKFPCPPFQLIKQPPNELRSRLNLRNQITPVAGVHIPGLQVVSVF
jgi:inosine-uridine nucleoside N-ribohydrolase